MERPWLFVSQAQAFALRAVQLNRKDRSQDLAIVFEV